MCKSIAEGGQRCYSHARASFDRADTALQKAIRSVHSTVEERRHAQEVHHRRIRDLASTPQGQADVEQMLQAARQRLVRHERHPVLGPAARDDVTYLETVLAQGEALRERNAAVAAAHQPSGVKRRRVIDLTHVLHAFGRSRAATNEHPSSED